MIKVLRNKSKALWNKNNKTLKKETKQKFVNENDKD